MSASKLASPDGNFTSPTIAATEMPEQQYAVFFGGEDSFLQTWWNPTTWFGRKSCLSGAVHFIFYLFILQKVPVSFLSLY
jgi:hypothetical protein